MPEYITPSVDIEFLMKNFSSRLVDGEVTEEEFVDKLEARSIPLVEANAMSDKELLTELALAEVRNFDRVLIPRFTEDVAELQTNDMDIRGILADSAVFSVDGVDGRQVTADNAIAEVAHA